MDCSSFHITEHAYKRMVARNITPTKLAQIMSCGQVYSQGDGRHKATLFQRIGNNNVRYEAIFSKSDGKIITVWNTIKPCRKDGGDDEKLYMKRKVYKRRKRTAYEKEFDSYCREEYSHYNMRFSA